MSARASHHRTGDADVLLSTAQLTTTGGNALGAVEFWTPAEQSEARRRTRLVIGTVPRRGSVSSLEPPTGQRFLTRSEPCTGQP